MEYFESFSMHNTRIIANKCARMFIFMYEITSVLMHHRKLHYVNSHKFVVLMPAKGFYLLPRLLTQKIFSVLLTLMRIFPPLAHMQGLSPVLHWTWSPNTSSRKTISSILLNCNKCAGKFVSCHWSMLRNKRDHPIGKIWSSAKQQYNYLIVSFFHKLFSPVSMSCCKVQQKRCEKKFPKWGSVQVSLVKRNPLLIHPERTFNAFCGWDNGESFTISIPKIPISFPSLIKLRFYEWERSL